MSIDYLLENSAKLIDEAEAFIITAGAGMGVDSGLPDFRGDRGFWKAYPMYEKLGLSFIDCANPRHFKNKPEFGWGFYGHRTQLYRNTFPHKGFGIIRKWVSNKPHFVVTSNVDGQFQKAGFDPELVCEIHGSIHHLQCTEPRNCETNKYNIWNSTETFDVNKDTMEVSDVPKCSCGRVARPNILMFGDYGWVSDRTCNQEIAFENFLKSIQDTKTVVIEMGAGTAIPSIRNTSEELGNSSEATVIRINPRESDICDPHISIPLGACEALTRINEKINL